MQRTNQNAVDQSCHRTSTWGRIKKTKRKLVAARPMTIRTLLILVVCLFSCFSQSTVWAFFYQPTGGLGGGTPRLIFVDASSADSGGGHNWDTAFNDLQTALRVAHAHRGPVEIRVAGGTYFPSDSDDQEATFLIQRNDLIIKGSMRSGQSILSGDIGIASDATDNCYHVVTFNGVDDTVILQDFEIRSGNASSSTDSWPYYHDSGGGIYSYRSNPKIERCDFLFNDATLNGGAVFLDFSNPSIDGCTFTFNNAGGGGGAIFGANLTELWVGASTFIQNTAESGGAIYSLSATSLSGLTVDQCSFENNSAEDSGGAIFAAFGLLEVDSSVFVENISGYSGGGVCSVGDSFVDDSSFENNIAPVAGGGIYASGDQIELNNCEFKRNESEDSVGGYGYGLGGGAFIYGGSSRDSAPVIDCTFFANLAVEGGGLWGRNMTVLNCHFRYNEAEEDGGGICGTDISIESCEFLNNVATSSSMGGGGLFIGPDGSSGTPRIVNCTFAKNEADHQGGGIYLEDTNAELVNCIFWLNFSGASGSHDEVFADGGSPTVNYSCVRGGWTGGGSRNITNNPLFRDLGSGDLRLELASPCIDAGDNSAVSTSEDLNGNDRISGSTVDLGSYERH